MSTLSVLSISLRRQIEPSYRGMKKRIYLDSLRRRRRRPRGRWWRMSYHHRLQTRWHMRYIRTSDRSCPQKLKAQLKVLEKTDLIYRQAKKAVEQVNAGVFTTSAFVDALSLQEGAVSRVEVLKASTTPMNQPGTTKAEITKLQPLDVWDLKQHGKLGFWGGYYGSGATSVSQTTLARS